MQFAEPGYGRRMRAISDFMLLTDWLMLGGMTFLKAAARAGLALLEFRDVFGLGCHEALDCLGVIVRLSVERLGHLVR